MNDDKSELDADFKALAAKLITPEAKERMNALSPAQRAKVIDVVSRIIAKDLSERAKKYRMQ